LKLFGYWRSSASWRVRIGLEWKGLDYTYVPVHLVKDGGEQKLPAHLQRNPMAQVPVLQVSTPEGPRNLSQSLAILRYLESVHPSPALVPTDPLEAALAWQLAEVVNAWIQPMQNLSTLQAVQALGADRMAWGREVIAKGLGAMEAMVAHRSGDTLLGTEVSVWTA